MAWQVVLPLLLMIGAYMQTWQLRVLPSSRMGLYGARAALSILMALLESKLMRTRRRTTMMRMMCELLRWVIFLVLFEPTPELRSRLPVTMQPMWTLLYLASWELPSTLGTMPLGVRRAVRAMCTVALCLVWPWMVLDMAKAAMMTLLAWMVWDGRHELWTGVAAGTLPAGLMPVLSRAVL